MFPAVCPYAVVNEPNNTAVQRAVRCFILCNLTCARRLSVSSTASGLTLRNPGLPVTTGLGVSVATAAASRRLSPRPCGPPFRAGAVLTSVLTASSRSSSIVAGGVHARLLRHRHGTEGSAPQPAGGELRSLDQGPELQVRDVRLHRTEAGESTEAAVRPGHDPLTPHDAGEALDAFGDQLPMLDVVPGRRQHARDQDLVVRHVRFLEQRALI